MNQIPNNNENNIAVSEEETVSPTESMPAPTEQAINPNSVLYQPPYTPPKPPREFDGLECIFAWLCLLAGYLFCRIFPVSSTPLGGFIFIIALFMVTSVIFKIKGFKFKTMPVIASASAITVSLALILSANPFLSFFAYFYALATYCYFIYAITGNSLKGGFSDLIAMDYFKALFMLPFCSFDELFRAMFSGKAGKGGKVFLKIFIGILIAIVPTVIVLILLSYDSGFSKLLSSIFDFNLKNVFSHIGSLILGIPVAMYLFGLFISSIDGKCSGTVTTESCEKTSQKIKIAPALTVIAATLPLLFLYVVFFISQWDYYISGFTGKLPEDFSYAGYAREGFFQLCAVSVVNLIVIMAVVIFMRRKKSKTTLLLKILTTVFSLFTLVLISTAVAKMIMYIECYGLTPKRVYATWFMVLLAVIFILTSIHQFVPKFKAIATSVCVCVVLFAALSLSGTDSLIATYNVDRYLDGTLETVDLNAMRELGDAAIPELVRLAENIEDKGIDSTDEGILYYDLTDVLKAEAEKLKNKESDVFTFNVPSAKAKKALARWTEGAK